MNSQISQGNYWHGNLRKGRVIAINKLKVGEKIIDEPNEICKNFVSYYTELYQKGTEYQEKVEEFFKQNILLEIQSEKIEYLNAPIMAMEIQQAIRNTKAGKSPGPDGLSACYYKKLEKVISQPIKEVMNDILIKGKTSETWKEAYIMLILKQGTDLTLIPNYRLNNDYKLFAAILAERLKKTLREIIHEDQAGFPPG